MNRTWTFVIGKPLTAAQLNELSNAGLDFVSGWTAHDTRLSATFRIYRERIIIVEVNESVHNASGCSIDKLTRFIKEMENKLDVQLLNRLLVVYEDESGSLQVENTQVLKGLISSGAVNAHTTVYNTSVANDKELSHWKQPLKDTWLNKYITA
jgi:hypothetical protein